MTEVLALSSHGYWGIALAIGLVAALVVAALLLLLIQAVERIRKAAGELMAVAGNLAANTTHIPKLKATSPVLEQIVQEAVVQDGYMNALTDGWSGK
jgi:hypothetical protein